MDGGAKIRCFRKDPTMTTTALPRMLMVILAVSLRLRTWRTNWSAVASTDNINPNKSFWRAWVRVRRPACATTNFQYRHASANVKFRSLQRSPDVRDWPPQVQGLPYSSRFLRPGLGGQLNSTPAIRPCPRCGL